jgi:RNA polymerase-binding transcription factor DksA
MATFEAEARDLLLRRRRSLRREASPAAASDPSARWLEVEGLPEPSSEQVRRELVAIEEALDRLTAGSYGTCLSCGGPMGLQRIRAIPEARYCVGCSGQVLVAAE